MSQYFFNYYSIPYFLSALVLVSVAALLLSKKRNDRHVQLFIVALFLLTITVFTAAMATCSRKPGIWDIWNSMSTISSIFGVTVLFHFSYVTFSKKEIFENKKLLLIYLIPLFFLFFIIINPQNEIVESPDTDLGIYGKEFTGPYSFFKPLFYSILGLMIILTTLNFIRMYRQSKETIQKKRALFFVLSFLIPLIGFTISVILVEIFRIFPRVQLGMVALSMTGAIITYGILKHQLFDIEFIVKKTFVYLVITLVLIGVFRLFELFLSSFISATFFGGDFAARLIAAGIVFCFFFPLRKEAIKIGDKLFPKLVKSVKYDLSHEMMVYKKQLEHALEDGVISDKEEKMLKALRVDLGISEEDHERLKREIIVNSHHE